MDSFEFNKIAGAILGTALGVMALSIVSEIIFQPANAEKPGYAVAGVEPTGEGTEPGGGTEGGGTSGGETTEVPPIAVRLASADVGAGERSAGKCKACHTFIKEGYGKTMGPNLWNVVGAPAAHLEGFGYSAAMKAKHDEGLTWTFENLDQFLRSPKAFIPGTKMVFAGIPKPDERANVIAYLRTLSDSPVPMPPAPVAEAPVPATDALPVPPAETPAPPAQQVPPGEPTTPPAN